MPGFSTPLGGKMRMFHILSTSAAAAAITGSPKRSLMGQKRQCVPGCCAGAKEGNGPAQGLSAALPCASAEVQRGFSARAKDTVIFLLYFSIKAQRHSR